MVIELKGNRREYVLLKILSFQDKFKNESTGGYDAPIVHTIESLKANIEKCDFITLSDLKKINEMWSDGRDFQKVQPVYRNKNFSF